MPLLSRTVAVTVGNIPALPIATFVFSIDSVLAILFRNCFPAILLHFLMSKFLEHLMLQLQIREKQKATIFV
jgi:hypothetical protein